jgi:hypothetical protein
MIGESLEVSISGVEVFSRMTREMFVPSLVSISSSFPSSLKFDLAYRFQGPTT